MRPPRQIEATERRFYTEAAGAGGSLFPVYLSDKVTAEHPARVADAVVEGLDLTELERTYKDGGTSNYSPRAMLKVIFYAYLSNVYSGRQIVRMWQESIIYMWLGGTLIPDFRTINNSRKNLNFYLKRDYEVFDEREIEYNGYKMGGLSLNKSL